VCVCVPCGVKNGSQHTGKMTAAEIFRKKLLTIFGIHKEEMKEDLTDIPS
jgi:hypothetical protein